MICPETRNACFDLDCQLNGCQGDGLRRLMRMELPRKVAEPLSADPYQYVTFPTSTVNDPEWNARVDERLKKMCRAA